MFFILVWAIPKVRRLLIPFVAHHCSLLLNYPPTVYRTPTRLQHFHRTLVQQQVTQVTATSKESVCVRERMAKFSGCTCFNKASFKNSNWWERCCCSPFTSYTNLFQRSLLQAPAATFISISTPSPAWVKPTSYLHSSFTFRLSALHKPTVTPALTQPTRKHPPPPFTCSSMFFVVEPAVHWRHTAQHSRCRNKSLANSLIEPPSDAC